jgi:hypothetical protein
VLRDLNARGPFFGRNALLLDVGGCHRPSLVERRNAVSQKWVDTGEKVAFKAFKAIEAAWHKKFFQKVQRLDIRPSLAAGPCSGTIGVFHRYQTFLIR